VLRRVFAGLVLTLAAASCGDVGAPTALVSRPLTIQRSPSPFAQVTAGEVTALIPDDWQAVASGEDDHPGGPEVELLVKIQRIALASLKTARHVASASVVRADKDC